MTELARDICPQCAQVKGKEDNRLSIYGNGKFCHGCGYKESNKVVEKVNSALVGGTVVEMADRGISLETCQKYNVRTTSNYKSNSLFRIFPIYKEGVVVKQKLKNTLDKKDQIQVGNTKYSALFGKQAFEPKATLPIFITEGEEDALALYQMLKYPAVSLTSGACATGNTAAKKQLLDNLQWLNGWKEVILCFDMDSCGRYTIQDCIPIFEPGKVKDMKLPVKDANEFLLKGLPIDTLKKCWWDAETLKPSSIVSPLEIKEDVLKQPQYGSPWPWDFMTKATHGNRLGELYILAGAPGIGKTQIVYEILRQQILNQQGVGLFDLERSNDETVRRIISSLSNKLLFVPNCVDWSTELIEDELTKIDPYIKLYNLKSGGLTLDDVTMNIRYMNKAFNFKYFIVDNLTALAVTKGNMKDYDYVSEVVGRLSAICKELNITMFVLSHLTKSKITLTADISKDFSEFKTNKPGLTWETGRKPTAEDIYGSICKLADYVMVISRNKISEDERLKRIIFYSFIKTRFQSDYEGKLGKMIYERDTGRLVELHEKLDTGGIV